jgi:hypothetical protein
MAGVNGVNRISFLSSRSSATNKARVAHIMLDARWACCGGATFFKYPILVHGIIVRGPLARIENDTPIPLC